MQITMMYDSFSGLTELTALYLSNRDADGYISLAPFSLLGLVALQVLNIKGSVWLPGVVSGLESLTDLTYVSVSGLRWCDTSMVSEIRLLDEKLCATRPDVMFECEMKQGKVFSSL